MKMGKHSLLMMAGCGVMLVGVFILPALGIKLGGVLPVLLALACPLSMLLMMGAMGKGHDHAGHSDHADSGLADDQGAPRHGETAPRALAAPSDRE